MRFEWDENKRQININKHGIDFVDAEDVFKGKTLTVEDVRFDYGEQRFITLGLMKGRVVVIVHTERDDAIRLISIRKASQYEKKSYCSRIADRLGQGRFLG